MESVAESNFGLTSGASAAEFFGDGGCRWSRTRAREPSECDSRAQWLYKFLVFP